MRATGTSFSNFRSGGLFYVILSSWSRVHMSVWYWIRNFCGREIYLTTNFYLTTRSHDDEHDMIAHFRFIHIYSVPPVRFISIGLVATSIVVGAKYTYHKYALGILYFIHTHGVPAKQMSSQNYNVSYFKERDEKK